MKNIFTTLLSILVFGAFAQPITSIPFEMYGDHMIVQISVDGSAPLDFIFDTASGLTVLDKDRANELGLSGKEIKIHDTNTTMEILKHNTFSINGFEMEKNIKVYTTVLRHLEKSLGRDIDGIFGYDLMVHHTLHIDYEQKRMDIYEHGGGPVSGDLIPFFLNMSIPTISASVILNNGEPLEGTFFVMTGAGTTLDFNSPFATKNDIIDKTGKHFSYLVKDISENETVHYEGHVEQLKFGKEEFPDLPVGISQAKSGIRAHGDVAGIIGNRLLSRYNITIDLPNKQFFFTQNSNYEKPILINSSGIEIQLSEDMSDILVHKVYENSPAEEVGVMLNDKLLAVNDKPVSKMTFPEIIDVFRHKDRKVSIKVLRDNEEKLLTFETRSLID